MSLTRRPVFSFLPALLAVVLFCSSFVTEDKWLQLKVKEQGYQIDFPQQPTEKPQTLETELGVLTMNILMLDASKTEKPDDNVLYLVNSTDYPANSLNSSNTEILPDFFRASIDGAVNNVKGTILSEKEISLDGFPGREVKVDFRDGMAFIRIRMYLVENRMYMVQTITMADKDNNPSIDRFLNSFKLLKKKK